MLLEGSSIRATARTVRSHKKTVSDLSKIAGRVAAAYQDKHLRNLELEQIELDEVWAFLYAKQKTAYEIGVRLVGSEMCIRDSSGSKPTSQNGR